MMVLPVNFAENLGLNSKPHCYYPIKNGFLLGELRISKKQALLSLLKKKIEIKDWSKNGSQ